MVLNRYFQMQYCASLQFMRLKTSWFESLRYKKIYLAGFEAAFYQKWICSLCAPCFSETLTTNGIISKSGSSEATEKWGVETQKVGGQKPAAEICLLLTNFALFSAKMVGQLPPPPLALPPCSLRQSLESGSLVILDLGEGLSLVCEMCGFSTPSKDRLYR